MGNEWLWLGIPVHTVKVFTKKVAIFIKCFCKVIQGSGSFTENKPKTYRLTEHVEWGGHISYETKWWIKWGYSKTKVPPFPINVSTSVTQKLVWFFIQSKNGKNSELEKQLFKGAVTHYFGVSSGKTSYNCAWYMTAAFESLIKPDVE